MREFSSGIILIIIGFLAVVGAALDWKIVSRSGKLLNRIFGDLIARAIYVAVGVVLIVVGAIQIMEL
jgi:uncharacterized membrane protein YidH (DUF202 family)